MKRVTKMVGLLFAIGVLGGMATSSASADGVLSATFSGEVGGNPVTTCDAVIDYTGTPGDEALLDAGTFEGDPNSSNPCDESTLTLNHDVNVDFAEVSSTWTATLDEVDVDATVPTPLGDLVCNFVAGDLDLESDNDEFGFYAGQAGASGSGGPFNVCGLVSADVVVSNGYFDED